MVTIEGNPWFVANEIASPLDLTIEGIKYHLKYNLASDERRVELLPTNNDRYIRRLTLVNESGLYKIVLRAQRTNPIACEFQDWVTKVVLPAIRKDGGYIMGEEKVVIGDMSEDELVLKALGILQKKAIYL